MRDRDREREGGRMTEAEGEADSPRSGEPDAMLDSIPGPRDHDLS